MSDLGVMIDECSRLVDKLPSAREHAKLKYVNARLLADLRALLHEFDDPAVSDQVRIHSFGWSEDAVVAVHAARLAVFVATQDVSPTKSEGET